ncbi:hypothetical protein CEXT_713201 [Caerostris extrusa]|uniref:Uncharacterized protein n=1 Tax=Caerostris extrusa TaxID=172846 RepID=A0AAV4TZS0_CAEEX|nr:hypothetical protein CEXT_713201 [Caerostris extrusa]
MRSSRCYRLIVGERRKWKSQQVRGIWGGSMVKKEGGSASERERTLFLSLDSRKRSLVSSGISRRRWISGKAIALSTREKGKQKKKKKEEASKGKGDNDEIKPKGEVKTQNKK